MEENKGSDAPTWEFIDCPVAWRSPLSVPKTNGRTLFLGWVGFLFLPDWNDLWWGKDKPQLGLPFPYTHIATTQLRLAMEEPGSMHLQELAAMG